MDHVISGRPKQLADGVWRLSLPMRFTPGHVNAYLLSEEGGWTVVDCGNHQHEVRSIWRDFMDSSQYGAGIKRIVLTHAHPDHSGSAAWLAAQTGAELCMAPEEEATMHRLWQAGDAHKAAMNDFFASWGATPDQQQGIYDFMQGFRMGCPLPETPVRHLRPGDSLPIGSRRWHLHGGYGHTACNLLLHDADSGLILTGDQVLPSIQPNVSLWFGAGSDPVGDFLRSLEDLAVLEVTSALPSHGDVFAHFSQRCEQQMRQQNKRLDRLRRALCDGVTQTGSLCQEVLGKVVDGPLFMLVAGQLYALLAHLEQNGEVRRRRDSTGVHFDVIN